MPEEKTLSGKRVYEIDGSRFASLEGFYDEVSRQLIPGANWGRNLDAFDDILSGGFGTPKEGFVLSWFNSTTSRERLGYTETARQLRLRLQHCHSSNRSSIEEELRQAEATTGPTVFDWLVDIIRMHGNGGSEQEDGVILELR